MLTSIYYLLMFGLSFVQAGSGWDDFSNNLATDLAPLLSLFGEQITKQYLSESTEFLDFFTFAMAPMGILTAVVSAIRVCGGPSLRAFIGRAQEGMGNAEAELCSSTSRDVCELYVNGGIARVLGRPKILEVVDDPESRFEDDDDDDDGQQTRFKDEKVGIYTFHEYVSNDGQGKTKWERQNTTRPRRQQVNDPEPGAPNENQSPPDPPPAFAPNLTLNIGIKKQPPKVFRAIAFFGLILQYGVLVFAGVVTYYLEWGRDGGPPDAYACPLVIVGTILVCGSMFLCAFLVGESTDEEVWHRKSNNDKASLHWLQPGGQVIGDQTFDAFLHTDSGELGVYTSSRKRQPNGSEHLAWGAAIISILAFVLQFTGLRGIHSSVAVAQLAVTGLMSVVRAALRMQRLKVDANPFFNRPDQILGHELDWLAIRIGIDDIKGVPLSEWSPESSCSSPSLSASHPDPDPDPDAYRFFWSFCSPSDSDSEERIKCVKGESDLKNTGQGEAHLNATAKVLAYRTRLAQLTESSYTQSRSMTSASAFETRMVEVRYIAQQLAMALDMAVNAIFSQSAKIQGDWENAQSMLWSIDCTISNDIMGSQPSLHHTVQLQLDRDMASPWKLKQKLQLEGLLGLWLWSLKSHSIVKKEDPQTHFTISRAAEIPTQRIISTDTRMARSDLRAWLASPTYNLMKKNVLHFPSAIRGDPSIIWSASGGSFEPISKIIPEGSEEHAARFFGWYAVDSLRADTNTEAEERIEAEDSSENNKNSELTVWSFPTKASLLSLCAQEVFGSFISSLLRNVVDEVGDVDILEERRYFRLRNHLVSELTRIFTESHLGSEDEALFCILPAVIPRLRMLGCSPPWGLNDSQTRDPAKLSQSRIRYSKVKGATHERK